MSTADTDPDLQERGGRGGPRRGGASAAHSDLRTNLHANGDVTARLSRRSRRPRLVRHIHAEWIKLRSLRSSRWLLIAAAAAVPLVGVALIAALLIDEDGSTRPRVFFDATFIGAQLSSLLLGALGAGTIAGEFSTRTAITTFTVAPARASVLAAKAAVLWTVTVLAAALAVGLTYLLTSWQLSSHDLATSLGGAGVVRVLLGEVLYLSGMSVLGLAIGALVRSTAASIGTLVVLLYAVPLTLALLPGSGPAQFFNRWLVTNTLTNFTHLRADDLLLTPAAGAAAFIAWIVVLYLAGAIRLRRARI
ncbi:ABC transporter permease [Kineococcus rhizosphaerae]|uniref:ABC-type transport system involved in multi-copper enzyme maturation permease subunit n=1 Tax=Kineococcus rhizosphaerae TaxID=559628 RepID=A0A2T0QQ05_9ACTN|nr:ABC transporter permease [Kineococcus rhizosphaerae]PRY06792.1 ABC-type transport system involved in multi-copper enzyme maturation permease subunit [Kineococcus rhizosphaerae]